MNMHEQQHDHGANWLVPEEEKAEGADQLVLVEGKCDGGLFRWLIQEFKFVVSCVGNLHFNFHFG